MGHGLLGARLGHDKEVVEITIGMRIDNFESGQWEWWGGGGVVKVREHSRDLELEVRERVDLDSFWNLAMQTCHFLSRSLEVRI